MATLHKLSPSLVFGCVCLLGTAALAGGQSDSEASLRAADARQLAVVRAGDDKAMLAMAHPNLRVNAPTGRILTRDELLSLMRTGALAAEHFERTPESVAITGSLGVVMGSETVVPTAESVSGKMFGAGKPLKRRYTNVYLLENGAWKFIARHANVVPPEAK